MSVASAAPIVARPASRWRTLHWPVVAVVVLVQVAWLAVLGWGLLHLVL